MKPFPQFPALFRYHATANPWIWVFPVALAPQMAIITFRHEYHYNLGFAFIGSQQSLWMPLIIAAFIFGSQIFVGMAGANASTNLQMQAFHPEFILTRAVDRSTVYWARAGLYWMMILIPVVLGVGLGFFPSSLSIELRPTDLDHYLNALPGSFVTSTSKSQNPVLFVPWGALWLKLWAAWVFLSAAALWQVFVFLILPLKWRRWLYWGAFVLCMAATISLPIVGRDTLEFFFLFSVRHQLLFGLLLVVLIPAALRFCRGRAMKEECP